MCLFWLLVLARAAASLCTVFTTDRLSPESHLVCPPSSLLSYSSHTHPHTHIHTYTCSRQRSHHLGTQTYTYTNTHTHRQQWNTWKYSKISGTSPVYIFKHDNACGVLLTLQGHVIHQRSAVQRYDIRCAFSSSSLQ